MSAPENSKTIVFSNILALILTLFSVMFFTILLFKEIPETNVRFIDTIIGFLLGSVVSVIINYYFGASLPTPNPPTTDCTPCDSTSLPPTGKYE